MAPSDCSLRWVGVFVGLCGPMAAIALSASDGFLNVVEVDASGKLIVHSGKSEVSASGSSFHETSPELSPIRPHHSNSLARQDLGGVVSQGGLLSTDLTTDPHPVVWDEAFAASPTGEQIPGCNACEVTATGCPPGDENKCMRVTYEASGSQHFKNDLPDLGTFALLSYDVYFEKHDDDNDFDWIKLGGLSPEIEVTGCPATRSASGWSARPLWKNDGKVGMYLYHQDNTSPCGDSIMAKNGDGTDFVLEDGTWYNLKLAITMNAPGQSPANGTAELQINDVTRAYEEGIEWGSAGDYITKKFDLKAAYASDGSVLPSGSVNPTITYDNFEVRGGDGNHEWRKATCASFSAGCPATQEKISGDQLCDPNPCDTATCCQDVETTAGTANEGGDTVTDEDIDTTAGTADEGGDEDTDEDVEPDDQEVEGDADPEDQAFNVGDRVQAYFEEDGKWYVGTVNATPDASGLWAVQCDHDDKGDLTYTEQIKAVEAATPPATDNVEVTPKLCSLGTLSDDEEVCCAKICGKCVEEGCEDTSEPDECCPSKIIDTSKTCDEPDETACLTKDATTGAVGTAGSGTAGTSAGTDTSADTSAVNDTVVVPDGTSDATTGAAGTAGSGTAGTSAPGTDTSPDTNAANDTVVEPDGSSQSTVDEPGKKGTDAVVKRPHPENTTHVDKDPNRTTVIVDGNTVVVVYNIDGTGQRCGQEATFKIYQPGQAGLCAQSCTMATACNGYVEYVGGDCGGECYTYKWQCEGNLEDAKTLDGAPKECNGTVITAYSKQTLIQDSMATSTTCFSLVLFAASLLLHSAATL